MSCRGQVSKHVMGVVDSHRILWRGAEGPTSVPCPHVWPAGQQVREEFVRKDPSCIGDGRSRPFSVLTV